MKKRHSHTKLLLSGFLLSLILLGGISAAEAAADVREVSASVSEKIENGIPSGKILTVVTLKNFGDAVAPPFIYEAQPLGVASFSTVSAQGVCLNSHPENQYRSIKLLQPNEQITFTIESPKLVKAIYDVYGVSFSNCCFIDGTAVACSPVQPYAPSGHKKLGSVMNSGGPKPPTVICGDNICNTPENVNSCAQDCKGYCGDAVCNAANNENTQNCPQDCGFPPNHCGNNQCEPQYGESQQTCATDCRITPPPVCPQGQQLCSDNVCRADCTVAPGTTNPLLIAGGVMLVLGAGGIFLVLRRK